MKVWPKDQPVVFGDLVDPLVNALHFAYQMERRNPDKDIPYEGYDLPNASGSVFNHHMMALREREGSSAAREIIEHAIALGIEQGIRIARK